MGRPSYKEYSKNGLNYLNANSTIKNVMSKFGGELKVGLKSYLGITVDIQWGTDGVIFPDPYLKIKIKSIQTDAAWEKSILRYKFSLAQKRRVKSFLSQAKKLRQRIIHELKNKPEKSKIIFKDYLYPNNPKSLKGSRAYAGGSHDAVKVYWKDFLGRRNRYDDKNDPLIRKTWNAFWIWTHEIMHYALGYKVPDNKALTSPARPYTAIDLTNFLRGVSGLPLRKGNVTRSGDVMYVNFEGNRTVSFHPNKLEPLPPKPTKPSKLPKKGDAAPVNPGLLRGPSPYPSPSPRPKYARANIKPGINDARRAAKTLGNWMNSQGLKDSRGLPDGNSFPGPKFGDLGSLLSKTLFGSRLGKNLDNLGKNFNKLSGNTKDLPGSLPGSIPPDGKINPSDMDPSKGFKGSTSFGDLSGRKKRNRKFGEYGPNNAPDTLPKSPDSSKQWEPKPGTEPKTSSFTVKVGSTKKSKCDELGNEYHSDNSSDNNPDTKEHSPKDDCYMCQEGNSDAELFSGSGKKEKKGKGKEKNKPNDSDEDWNMDSDDNFISNNDGSQADDDIDLSGSVPDTDADGNTVLRFYQHDELNPSSSQIILDKYGNSHDRPIHPDLKDEFLNLDGRQISEKEMAKSLKDIIKKRKEIEGIAPHENGPDDISLDDFDFNSLLNRFWNPLIRPTGPNEDEQNTELSDEDLLVLFKQLQDSSSEIKYIDPDAAPGLQENPMPDPDQIPDRIGPRSRPGQTSRQATRRTDAPSLASIDNSPDA